MNTSIQTFQNSDFGSIRTLTINDEPWFVGKDVAEILGYERPTKSVVDHVDEDDRLMLDGKTQSQFGIELGQRGGWLINESGLYSLILSSKLPTAKQFKRWVTSEVLPSIHKHGGYIAGQNEMSAEELMAKALMVAQKTLAEREARISALTVENQIMTPKAEYFDELVNRNLLTGLRETAKELCIPQNKFISYLLDQKYLYRNQKGKLMPYQTHVDDGIFELKECYNDKTQWGGTQTMVTPKGRETFRLLMVGVA